MKLIQEKRHNEMIPAWYGIAWYRMNTDTLVCLPVPLNLLAALGRAIVIWMRYGYKTMPCNPRDAYAQGVWSKQHTACKWCTAGIYRPHPSSGKSNPPPRKP